jgi:hypothetical protein
MKREDLQNVECKFEFLLSQLLKVLGDESWDAIVEEKSQELFVAG